MKGKSLLRAIGHVGNQMHELDNLLCEAAIGDRLTDRFFKGYTRAMDKLKKKESMFLLHADRQVANGRKVWGDFSAHEEYKDVRIVAVSLSNLGITLPGDFDGDTLVRSGMHPEAEPYGYIETKEPAHCDNCGKLMSEELYNECRAIGVPACCSTQCQDEYTLGHLLRTRGM